MRSTLDLSPPYWRDDPDFDPRRHIHRVPVPAPADEAAFRRVVDEIFARPLAADRPLWECHLLEGLADGRAALLTKVHHCMIDGVSGVQVLEVMTDGWEARPGAEPPVPPARSLAARAQDLLGGVGRALERVAHPGRVVADLQTTAAAAGATFDLMRERLRPFSFNGPLGHTRRIVWATFELDEFLAMRGAAGCKVNDVALAVIAGGLRRFLPAEATAAGRRARALIPMNVRRDDEHLTLGNRVSGMFVSLPLDVADARERLHLIAAEMRAAKEAGQSRAFDFALGIAGTVPTALAPLLSRVVQLWPVAHTVCTNVPGPRETRALLGKKIVDLHPIVPLAAGIGLGFAILSYAGKLSITATADATLVADVDRLPAALRAAADELAYHLGVRAERPESSVKRRGALTVGELMTRDVIAVGPRDLLSVAWRTMREHRIRHLPVVDRGGIAAGADQPPRSAGGLAELALDARRGRSHATARLDGGGRRHGNPRQHRRRRGIGRGRRHAHGPTEDRLHAGGRCAWCAGRHRDRGGLPALVGRAHGGRYPGSAGRTICGAGLKPRRTRRATIGGRDGDREVDETPGAVGETARLDPACPRGHGGASHQPVAGAGERPSGRRRQRSRSSGRLSVGARRADDASDSRSETGCGRVGDDAERLHAHSRTTA